MALKLKGSTSGFVAIDAPSVAGNNTLILPENTGSAQQLLGNDITAGVVTFTSVTVNRNGDLTVPGTISIGGTLTYEDVTSVDSVGIVTARSGVRINGGGLTIIGDTTGLNATGISTLVDVSARNITGVAATFSGDVSIADKIVHTGDTNTAIRFPSADTFTVETAGSERIRVDSSGNFGVGTNNPAYKTQIQVTDTTAYSASTISANQFQLSIANGGASGVAGILFVTEPSSGNGGHCGIRALSTGSGSSALTFSTRGSNTSAERLRITSTGYVGINQNSPGTRLHVVQDWVNSYGSISAEGGADALVGLGLRSNGNYRASVIWRDGSSGNYMDLATYGGSYPLLLRTNGTEGARISGNQNLLVGTTTDTQRLHVYNGNGASGYKTALFDSNDTSNGTRVVITNSGNTSNRGLGIMVGGNFAGTDKASFGWFNNDNTYVAATIMTITSDSKILMGGTDVYGTFENSSTSPRLQVRGTDLNGSCQAWIRATADAGAPKLFLANTRNTSANSHTVVQNGDELGGLFFAGSDGSQFVNGASITSTVGGSPGADDVPGMLHFGTNSGGTSTTERMRIHGNGQIRVGGSISGNPQTDFDVVRANSTLTDVMLVKGNVGNGFIRFQDNDNSCNWSIGVDDGSSTSTNSFIFYDRVNSQYRLQISDGGKVRTPATYNLTTTGGGPLYVESDGDLLRYTSSIKYKTDIETIENEIADKILNCRPVKYKSKCVNDVKTEGSDKSDWTWYGFIAEEVAEIEPRLVNWATKDFDNSVGESVERDPSNYEAEGVRYDNFVPLLVNLAKRQKEEIELLKARLDAAGL